MSTYQVIPAQPGYFLVHADFVEGDAWIDEAVIAFAVEVCTSSNGTPFTCARPVILGSYGYREIYVLRPDGQVEEPEGPTWQTFDEFHLHVKETSVRLKTAGAQNGAQ